MIIFKVNLVLIILIIYTASSKFRKNVLSYTTFSQ